MSNYFRGAIQSILQWFDTDFGNDSIATAQNRPDKVDLVRCVPFISLHVGCLGIYFTGWSWFAVATAFFLYFIRMFAITGFYHRYFSHRTFQTTRLMQFIFALLGGSAAQRGPLWWAYQHRHHHKHSDELPDPHSPRQHGFLWAHVGWFTSSKNFPTDYSKVKDLAKYPELVFLNRFDSLVPFLLALGLLTLGMLLEKYVPSWGVTGGQLLVWGFFVSTTALFHGTASINSLAHLIGRKRFDTTDDSRNSWILAMVTLGEGWHNNHHHYMHSARQGFYWWEVDITYYLLRGLALFGIIWDLRPVPQSVLAQAHQPLRSPAEHR